MTARRSTIMAGIVYGASVVSAESPFATRVVEYAPAPGQFVNVPQFDDPLRALGPPSGGGIAAPNNVSVVTLGGFGGFIVLAFDHLVRDDRMNRFGMDAIVFGNAYWVGGDPQRHWAECVTIEISKDENGNGEPDDTWYLIPGSHVPDPAAQFSVVWWDDNVPNATYPPDDQLWIPPERSGLWSSSGYELPPPIFAAVVIVNPSVDPRLESIFGYGEYSPTLILGDVDADDISDADVHPADFYTWPDDPRTVGMSPGSGGGDAFDIAWAVDPMSGARAHLDGFHFIRLTTAVDFISPILGEKSGEIDAVADAAPDPFGDADMDGDIDLGDVSELLTCWSTPNHRSEGCAQLDFEPNGLLDLNDAGRLLRRLTGPRHCP